MEKISNRALIARLYNAADQNMDDANYDIESWQQWYQAVQGLIAPEKMVYIIVKLNQNVTSGGFTEFYEASWGVFAPEIIHVLTEIKAVASADIVSSSLSIMNPTGLLDKAYKAFIFKAQPSEEQKTLLHAEDVRYDQLQDIENLEDLLGNYLQEVVSNHI